MFNQQKTLSLLHVSGYTSLIKPTVSGYTMFLTFGLNVNNELTSIREVSSGKTLLVCPYCKQSLIAKKGKINEHHFAHVAETCAVSIEAVSASSLPTFDKFELLTNAESTYLERRAKYQHKNIFHFSKIEKAVSLLEVMGILTVEYEENSVISDTITKVNKDLKAINRSFIVKGKPNQTLQSILNAIEPLTHQKLLNCWEQSRKVLSTSINRSYHAHKLDKQTRLQQFIDAQGYWFDCHYKRIAHTNSDFLPLLNEKMHQLNAQHLYLFQFDMLIDNKKRQLVKIGMTTRDPKERLKEVQEILKLHAKITTALVLATCEHAGRVERLLHRFYHNKQLQIGTFTEFFELNSEEISALVKDMETTVCTEYSPPQMEIKKEPQTSGRKKKSDIELIAEHADIVSCLKTGMGIRETARETKSGVNTVQRVKKALT